MNFTSLQYLIFLVIVSLVYFGLPKKIKIYWLLICSYYFYMSWNIEYSLLLFVSTITLSADGAVWSMI